MPKAFDNHLDPGERKQYFRTAWRAIDLLVAGFLLAGPNFLFADGGTLRLVQRDGDHLISVFTSPATPRVGIVDISVLVQDGATGKLRDDIPVTVALQSVDRPDLLLQKLATSDAATNKIFRAALFSVPQPGLWRAEVTATSDSTATPNSNSAAHAAEDTIAKVNHAVSFDLAVAPALPAWLEISPWVGWPLAVLGLFLLHQTFVYRSIQ